MNSYPNLPTQYATKGRQVRKTEVDEATNGAPRIRVLHDRRRREIPLVHPDISRAQWDALLAFYDANAAAEISYQRVRDGVTETYTVVMVEPPQELYVKGNRYTVYVTLREV